MGLISQGLNTGGATVTVMPLMPLLPTGTEHNRTGQYTGFTVSMSNYRKADILAFFYFLGVYYGNQN